MLVFPGMLVDAATQAGIKVPRNPDKFDKNKFPHFSIFCTLQLGRPMKMDGEHWRNAKIITSVPEDKIRIMTLLDFLALGLEWQQ